MDSLRLYNTLTGKKEEFSPLSGDRVGMYVCGITPYDYAHLGHARCYVVFDVLRRYLEHRGYKVNYIQNITDIDDKIIKKSRETGLSPGNIAEKYFADFQDNMELLNVRPATFYPRVSENIDEIISFIRGLIENGNAYESAGSVYFRTDSYSDYGRLSGRDPEDMIAADSGYGAQKKNPADFALWKKDEEFGWKSPWGKGRPGWHIECSAISKKFLGEEFDIHGGGLDLVFPHHENEVAQSKALTGKNPVKFWIHNGMVNLKGDKMAKSTGNFFLLKELLASYNPMVVRMYLLSTGYRQVLNFDPAELDDTSKAFNKLCEFKKELLQIDGQNGEINQEGISLPEKADAATKGSAMRSRPCESAWKNNLNGSFSARTHLFQKVPKWKFFRPSTLVFGALSNDLNTSAAIGEIFKIVNPLTEKIFNERLDEKDIKKGLAAIAVMENIIGVDLTVEEGPDAARVEKLLDERRRLRKEKKYAGADRIRDKLLKEGIEIKDTPSGTKWFRK
ncbi:MAG: cysteine--tRNA ligase [Elusimicrobiota bacterium]|nr:cysteine--tRNA ligase [Elusimicrobiota bacterium]